MKWLAGYNNAFDWYIVPNTEENQREYSDLDGDEYPTFSDAKKALLEIVRERIRYDRAAIKDIRAFKKGLK